MIVFVPQQICSFGHWSNYPVQPMSPDTVNSLLEHRINRLWSERNEARLRYEPRSCSDVDALLEACVEMSKNAPLPPQKPASYDADATALLAPDRNDSACFSEATVEDSTACW